MMSKKKWFVLLCFFSVYLLLGATIFYQIESQEERNRMEILRQERKEIEDLLKQYMSPKAEHKIFQKLSDYCGKTLEMDMSQLPVERKWDFYHSLFFVITVVSTIGYGNLAPTTMFSRIFMIFYGLIGIPMNGIVMVTLGGFFSRSFTKLYNRWKSSKMHTDTARLGLTCQIVLYLVPGFTFFIFLPSVIMMVFEGWAYDVAVYYSFVTLTTIGFGDYVAGVNNEKNFSEFFYISYKIFLLIWVIGGIGYVVMILNFITQAMRSKKIQEFEQMLAQNIKKTPVRIREELRSLLQEFLFLRVKRVYKGDFEYIPTHLERCRSCPDLTIYRNMNSPTMIRKRAFSECPSTFILHRVQSEADLERIDKDKTFQPANALMQQKDLLLKVVDALGNFERKKVEGYDGFSDAEILESELYDCPISVPKRRRAISEVKVPNIYKIEDKDLTWYGQDASNKLKDFRTRTFSMPVVKEPQGILAKLKNKFIPAREDRDVEKQDFEPVKDKKVSTFSNPEERYIQQTSKGRPSILSLQQEQVLEQTSIADFIRALSAVTGPDFRTGAIPKRKLGTAGLAPPNNSPQRRPSILQTRRTSLVPVSRTVQGERRRFSLRPVEEHLLAPPPYTPRQPLSGSSLYSRTGSPAVYVSPVQKQLSKKEKE